MCQQVIKKKRWDQRRRHCSCSTCAPAVSQAGIGAKEPSTATARHLAGHLDSSGFIRHLARHDVLKCSRRLHQVICSSSWEKDLPIRAEAKQNAEKPPRAKALNIFKRHLLVLFTTAICLVPLFPLFNSPLFCLFGTVSPHVTTVVPCCGPHPPKGPKNAGAGGADGAKGLGSRLQNGIQNKIPGLVNIQKTMENHHF